VHIHFVDVDESGSEGEELAVITERRISSFMIWTATQVTVLASYPDEGRSEFARTSREIISGAETRFLLDMTPTRTREVTRDVRRTSRVEDTSMLDRLDDEQALIVLS
jgi:ribonuclease PH